MSTANGELNGKVAVVTGAGSGIGRATAERLAASGARVIAADLNESSAKETAAALSGEAITVDVSDESSVQDFFTGVRSLTDHIDILVNVAGVQRAARIAESDTADWDLQMAVNARGCYLMIKHAIPLMGGRPGGSTIVNVASAGGVRGFAGLAGYSASKAAIISLSKTAALELAADGIRVNTVSPGWVDTPFNDPITAELGGRPALEAAVAQNVPLQRQSEPPEAAAVITFLCSPSSSFVTGHNLVADGGMTV